MADVWADLDVEAALEADGKAVAEKVESRKEFMSILIDARPAMYTPRAGADARPWMSYALEATSLLLRKFALETPNAKCCIILMGTVQRKSHGDFEGVYILRDLKEATAADILKLKEYATRPEELVALVGKVDDENASLPIDTALWAASHEFQKIGAKVLDNKRIWIFTCDDSPNANRIAAATRAKDAYMNGEEIVLWPFQDAHAGKEFSPEPFWATILSPDAAVGAGAVPALPGVRPDVGQALAGGSMVCPTDDTFEALRANLLQRAIPRRVYTTLPLDIVPGITIALQLYNIFHPAKPPSSVTLAKDTLQTVKSEYRALSEQTGEVVEPHNIVKYFACGGRQVCFSAADMTDIKSLGQGRGMKLLGFKPQRLLPFIESMRPSVFFYPTDKLVEGSVRTYRGLLDRCLARSMAIICEVVVSERFSPRHVALIPQAERKDEEGTIVVPGGFFGVILPFADDIRHISVATPPDQPPVAEDTVCAARNLVNKLSLREPLDVWKNSLPNPAIGKAVAHLEGLALNQTEEEIAAVWSADTSDFTRPSVADMARAAENELFIFREMAGLRSESAADTLARLSAPRKAAGTGTRTRKPVAPDEPAADEGVDWGAAYAGGTIARHTIPQLKAFLRAHEQKLDGTKPVLVERVVAQCAAFFPDVVPADPAAAAPKRLPAKRKARRAAEEEGDEEEEEEEEERAAAVAGAGSRARGGARKRRAIADDDDDEEYVV